ncbi:uncharacterized protein LOC105641502 isoform X3 [Jatropha curcas]|uniref:uncharacterized protein LOC105641502 isoform X3 n=1 Tax=Jatropha curcas TaxID=180498 RepID=UPI0009D6C860|nr:uncharacterized protein LOC105641502 isoform X3 [Jatropha curcas]
MCIAVFLWQAHPLYPFLLLLNRDEYHSRPTKPLSWWGSGDQILGGRDEQAGGTWLACTRDGKIAFVTNVRELESIPEAKSRGDLPIHFLMAQRLGHNFKDLLDKYGDSELPVNEMVEKLMMNTIKDEENMLPKIYPAEFEHQLSSIFVDTDTPLGRYGTRSTSAVSVKSGGEVNFYERHLENEKWLERTESFKIEMEQRVVQMPYIEDNGHKRKMAAHAKGNSTQADRQKMRKCWHIRNMFLRMLLLMLLLIDVIIIIIIIIK